ncbi:Na(+)/H(+) antiporter NhaA [Actinomycetes bacterium]|nr:Na(+)/H(+) antiporter NhaA [Actinomycetes bacterium]
MTTPDDFLARPSLRERNWVLEQLRDETFGGVLLLIAAALALIWANSTWSATYFAFVQIEIGPPWLSLPLSAWAADALLAFFFFVVGLELKHEFVLGSLSKPAKAAVPIAGALGGMVLSAAIFFAINATAADGSTRGWGIPMASDIAFGLAVLAVVGKGVPVALRAFLLTLAVVNDLGAILVIGIFYSSSFNVWWVLSSIACFIIYWYAQRRRITSAFIYVPLVIFTWISMYESGIHATVAGVVIGLLTRVKLDPGEARAPADRVGHRLHPLSAGFCVPVFAFCVVGVDLTAIGLGEVIGTPIAMGVIIGLVVGQPIGVVTTSWIVARFTKASLAAPLKWLDVTAIGLLAGIGFTVPLLIAEVAYGETPLELGTAKTAILTGSITSALLASILLVTRNRHFAAIESVEERDADGDGIPDVYQQGPGR